MKGRVIETRFTGYPNESRNPSPKLEYYLIADVLSRWLTKTAVAIYIWENRQVKLVITSDLEAVAYARVLGLLPVPKKVLELIYQNIDAN